MSVSHTKVLSQSFELGYTYTRSTGPIVGRFLGALKNKRVLGIRGSDGAVIVPPMEYDPVTAEALSEFVPVADRGTVTTWSWVKHPREKHLLDRPFAWAMIKLDGADVPMLHMVDAGEESLMFTGMSVQVRWADETRGHITDISCFEPSRGEGQIPSDIGDDEPITNLEEPLYLKYNFTAGESTAQFLAQLKKGRLTGQRCPLCKKVYAPPRGSCARCGVATVEEVQLSDHATVQSFTIVHIPIPGNLIKPPYVIANLVPDGSNLSFIHLLSECENEDVRIGMRVEAVWKPEEEWGYQMENIRYFRPLAEPDMPIAEIGK
ncbi:MAG: putative OB-fold protein [Halieaceae bacterium]|jgi:uncharacterized OB-fold protein